MEAQRGMDLSIRRCYAANGHGSITAQRASEAIHMARPIVEDIHIRNLRGIEDLYIDGFSRLNVFVGPNNSGKTTVLEALFLMVGMSNPQLSLNINSFRDLLISEKSDFRLNFRDLDYTNAIHIESTANQQKREVRITPIFPTSVETDIGDVTDRQSDTGTEQSLRRDAIGLSVDFGVRNGQTSTHHCSLRVDGNTLKAKRDDTYQEPINARMLNHRTIQSNLPEHFDTIQRTKVKDRLLRILQRIEPSICDLALSSGNVVMADIGLPQLIPLNLMGDGFRKATAVATNLTAAPDSVFMIDEIENGLHFQTMAVVWEAMIEAIDEFGLQVFVTTHSYESLRILSNVFGRRGYDKTMFRLYSVQRPTPREHKCYSYSLDELSAYIDQDVEFRGRHLT